MKKANLTKRIKQALSLHKYIASGGTFEGMDDVEIRDLKNEEKKE